MKVAASYTGPECPRCRVTLTPDWIRSGDITCPFCNREFEATAFQPQQQRPQLVTTQVIEVGPEGANSCANHARNAATASCQRCGLFICTLCELNVGSGSFCPQCFDRVRDEGTLQSAARRYRDYAGIARAAAIVGLLSTLFFGSIPCGALAIYYGYKGRAQRREEGRSVVGVTITMIVGALEILLGLAVFGLMIYSVFQTTT